MKKQLILKTAKKKKVVIVDLPKGVSSSKKAKVGILKLSVPCSKMTSVGGIILKGQCVSYEHVSPDSVLVFAADGRNGVTHISNIRKNVIMQNS